MAFCSSNHADFLEGAQMACNYNNDKVCAPCDEGSYSGGGTATVCTRCPAGSALLNLSSAIPSVKNNNISTITTARCTACQKYANAEQTGCVDACLPGSYASSLHSCSWCPAGTFSANGTICIACLGCVSPTKTSCVPAATCIPTLLICSLV